MTGHPLLRMSEDDLQTNVLDAVTTLGGMAYHTHDSRRSAKGFPDLVIVFPRTGALLFVELKSTTGSATPEQVQWLDALRRAERVRACTVHLWRPEDWLSGHIVETLTRCSRELIR